MLEGPRLCTQPRSQGLFSLPLLVVGRKTLVAAGHMTTCDTNFSTGVESTNNICQSQLKQKKGDHCYIQQHTGKYTFEYSKLHTLQHISFDVCEA